MNHDARQSAAECASHAAAALATPGPRGTVATAIQWLFLALLHAAESDPGAAAEVAAVLRRYAPRHVFGDDSDCVVCGEYGPTATAGCKPSPRPHAAAAKESSDV